MKQITQSSLKSSLRTLVCAGLLASFAGLPLPAFADDNPVILAWFETKWTDMERRVPDFFLAGYGGVWMPPPVKANSTGSAGYDAFDRFDLGSPASPTAYGTEQYFKAVIDELHQANAEVYIDAVLNHNSGRDGSTGFQNYGGWPGFWMAPATPAVTKTSTSNWGDFHNGNASGYYQSENPGGSNYDLYRGDLVGLCDIAQESNNQFIRHPVAAGNPQNIPAGSGVNLPNPLNTRCYPDRNVASMAVVNPGTSRNPGTNNFSFYPYNAADPSTGDPVADNTTGLLMRWSQWMCDVYKVDGFRLDAIKHTPSWFWDTYFDSAIHNRRILPDGRRVTPFSFGECVESPQFTYSNYIRKDAFGNRDALDINGSGSLRDLLNSAGNGNWLNVLSSHLDNADDNDNNGSIGVNHVFSHDNGTTGDGGSAPPNPSLRQLGYFTNAYVMMRTGKPLIHHNARGITRPGGFWPKHGITTALGVDPVTNVADPTIPTLVRLHTSYARDAWNVLNSTDTVNSSLDDVIIFERRKNLGGGSFSANCLVAANDRFDSGTDTRSVQTSFAAGTRLLEMTGNAANAVVDPGNSIPEVLTVDANRRVLITIPRNKTGANEHNKGFLVYALAIPSGTLTISPSSGTLPADPVGAPSARRRLNPIPVVSGNTFDISLTTTNGDLGAGNNNNADDNAVFRIDQGYRDFNASGGVDIDGTNGFVPGYEQFVTQHQPLAGTANSQGLYRQTIDTSLLADGYHYISVVAFRKRNANESPIVREFRQVIFVDRAGAAAQFVNPPTSITTTSQLFSIKSLDRNTARAYLILDVPDGADPLLPPYSTLTNACTRNDRFDWSKTLVGFTHGWHTATLTVFEESNKGRIYTHDFFVDLCSADFNNDGAIDFFDYDEFVQCFEGGPCPPGQTADFDADGTVDFFDYDAFVADFESGC
ncbi:MAG: alpha-amylase family glycosyl hydrolase [Planctomycetota bacterium]